MIYIIYIFNELPLKKKKKAGNSKWKVMVKEK